MQKSLKLYAFYKLHCIYSLIFKYKIQQIFVMRLLNHLDDDDGRIMPSSLPCAACQSLSAANNVSNHNHRLFDRNHHHLLLIPPGLSISSVPGYGTPNRWRRTDGTATLDKICVVVKDIITQN